MGLEGSESRVDGFEGGSSKCDRGKRGTQHYSLDGPPLVGYLSSELGGCILLRRPENQRQSEA